MNRGYRYFASVCLSTALIAPVGALAIPTPQDEHERHEQEERERRVYDEDRHEYRNWDKREDEAYRHWLDFKHRTYVEYEKLDRKAQREYWKWRHEHEEHEEHEHEHQ
jgi:hypothetical protein